MAGFKNAYNFYRELEQYRVDNMFIVGRARIDRDNK